MQNGKRPGDILINVNHYKFLQFYSIVVLCILENTKKMFNKSFIVSKPEKQNKDTNNATKQIKINKLKIGWSVGYLYLCLKVTCTVYKFYFCTM